MISPHSIQKAGGVVVRMNAHGQREVFLIHRPRYNDWSLPKGHIEPGEDAHTAALREIEEETGFLIQFVRDLPDYAYQLPSGEHVQVHMIEVHYVDEDREPDQEVDHGAWKTIDEACELFSYPSLVDYLRAQYTN